MYPPGIRVIKVSADTEFGHRSIGMTGTVVVPTERLHKDADMAVAFDRGIQGRVSYRPAGTIWSCQSKHWRPINPDEGLEDVVENKELEDELVNS